MNIQYVAMYSLMAGHFAQRSYSFDVPMMRYERSVSGKSNSSVSLDRRNTQTILHGIDEFYDIQTRPLPMASDSVKQMREFLDSAMNGQYFQIDPLGTADVPDSPIEAILEGTDYSETRISQIYLQFAFKVRKAAGRQVNVAGVVGGPVS